MKKIIFAFLLFLVLKEVHSQNTFQKSYGKYGESGYSVQQTGDGEFVIVGSAFDGMFKHILLIKTDSKGDTLWTKVFGGSADNYGYCIQQTTDGGFIITGSTNSFHAGYYFDVYLIKTNANGDTLWTKTYGGNYNSDGYFVRQTSDGGFIILGHTVGACLIKTDSNGNLLWSKAYSGSGGGNSVQQTTDGGFIIAGGIASSGAGGVDVYVIKTDTIGNVLWTKTFGGTEDDIAFSIQQTEDNGFIITGETHSFGTVSTNVYLIKMDENGILSWSKTFGGGLAQDVRQTADKGFIIVGQTSFGAGWSDIYLVKTDMTGNLVWSKTFGGTEDDFGYSVQQTTDGGFIVGGMTKSFGSGSGSHYLGNVYLIKTDAYGNSGCNETSPSTIQANPATIQGTVAIVLTIASIQVNSPATFIGHDKPIQTNLCSNSITTGIKKIENNSPLVVYPSPTNGIFQVHYTSIEKSNLLLNIIDSKGKTVYTETVSQFQGELKKELDLSKQAKGIYFIEIIDGKRREMRKIVLN